MKFPFSIRRACGFAVTAAPKIGLFQMNARLRQDDWPKEAFNLWNIYLSDCEVPRSSTVSPFQISIISIIFLNNDGEGAFDEKKWIMRFSMIGIPLQKELFKSDFDWLRGAVSGLEWSDSHPLRPSRPRAEVLTRLEGHFPALSF
jgi:hypothetical protein